MILYMLIGVGSNLSNGWLNEAVDIGTSPNPSMTGFDVMGAALIFMMLCWQVPKLFAAVLGGSTAARREDHGEPQIGDSVRWNISPAVHRQSEDATSVVVLKPQEPGPLAGDIFSFPKDRVSSAKYDSRISYGQDGLQVVWDRIIFPDASTVDINGMVGLDAHGNSGLMWTTITSVCLDFRL